MVSWLLSKPSCLLFKLNVVIIRGGNDDKLIDLARLSVGHAWHGRFIEVMPIGNVQDWGEGFPVTR